MPLKRGLTLLLFLSCQSFILEKIASIVGAMAAKPLGIVHKRQQFGKELPLPQLEPPKSILPPKPVIVRPMIVLPAKKRRKVSFVRSGPLVPEYAYGLNRVIEVPEGVVNYEPSLKEVMQDYDNSPQRYAGNLFSMKEHVPWQDVLDPQEMSSRKLGKQKRSRAHRRSKKHRRTHKKSKRHRKSRKSRHRPAKSRNLFEKESPLVFKIKV